MDEYRTSPMEYQTIVYKPQSDKEEAYRVPSSGPPANLAVGDMIADSIRSVDQTPVLWLEIADKKHSFHYDDVSDECIQVTEVYTKIAIRTASWAKD